jgi:hypothetical protein
MSKNMTRHRSPPIINGYDLCNQWEPKKNLVKVAPTSTPLHTHTHTHTQTQSNFIA